MALEPLITSADLDTYGYTLPAAVDEDAMIARASARLRRRVRQDITTGETTGLVLHGPGPWLLPQRPVVEVTEVRDADGIVIPTTSWCLAGPILTVRQCAGPFVSVDYAHGYATLPDGLVELVCQVTARIGNAPAGLTSGVTTEQGGNESVTWGSDAWAGVSGLTAGEEAGLRAYFPNYPRTVHVL